jgi:hypothetical protein
MKKDVAIAIGVGVGLVTGAIIGGASYAIYKSLKAVLKHESYTVTLNAGSTSTGNKATVFHYPELKMSVIKIPSCKFTIADSGNGTGTTLSTSQFPADLVADAAAGMTFRMPTEVFKGALAEGEYVVAKVTRASDGSGVVVFSLATSLENEKQESPLHLGAWEIVGPIIVTWESK